MRLTDESICIGKDGTSKENGDHIYDGVQFKAVFDGATPKGKRLWDGIPGDVYASRVLCELMSDIRQDICPASMITYLCVGVRYH